MSFVCAAESTDIDFDGTNASHSSAAEQVRVGQHVRKISEEKPFRIIVYHITFCVAGLTRVSVDVTAICSRYSGRPGVPTKMLPDEQTDVCAHLLLLK